ncbi:GNAT family N-acetyltransferase [Paenibacillus cremeus]|uniref:GNAT family N-acetyltransferase n=1 Tax=Paenibacillus cremeus TaxID=2163881 RepID=A0A559KE96_9BACL|nr:GNAT family N-acetyltransferase [Paenibacillus cremeus]TVY10450.1 GNAT family N-acetyltransferase [Paenibacillus cremeus]
MNVTIQLAAYEEKSVLRQLLELYKYDFSEYDSSLDMNEHVRYEYKYLDHYWTEERRSPFLVRVDGKLAGFALVWQFDQTAEGVPMYSMAEFFVMKKYRRTGLGKQVACHLFGRFEGLWIVKQVEENLPARQFWQTVIAEHTGGQYEVVREDGWDGPIHRFRSP